jgi:DNA-binding transcriptional MerR regulator/methylmalonyl-CoA mutase cobalamin-binding subunit
MYTIKRAALRSGLPVETIRAWERRYDVVRPTRTSAGYRLYDDDAIARLIAMRQLVEIEGMRPSQAAEQLQADPAAVARLVDEASRGLPSPDGRAERSAEASAATVAAFVAAAGALDVPGMERALDEGFAAERFEAALAHVVFPALRAVGEGWASGELDVGMEHAASETVRRRLARFYEAAGSSGSEPQVLIGLPPGAHHELGALAFAVTARRGGLEVLYLGADVPLESWRRAATTTAARVAVIGVTTRADVRHAAAVVADLGEAGVPATLAVGGSWAGSVAGPDGPIVLSADIEAAVDEVRDLVAAGA